MSSFWTEADDKHRQIAKTFYKNIEYDHPNCLSGRSDREFGWCGCSWCATSVKYYDYSGPDVQSI